MSPGTAATATVAASPYAITATERPSARAWATTPSTYAPGQAHRQPVGADDHRQECRQDLRPDVETFSRGPSSHLRSRQRRRGRQRDRPETVPGAAADGHGRGGLAYAIKASNAVTGTGLSNYTITYVNGQLTVNPAATLTDRGRRTSARPMGRR